MPTLLRRCPKCKSSNTARSHRKVIERVLLRLKPYRCNQCKHRFYSTVTSDKVNL